MNLLITGISGFVGQSLTDVCVGHGWHVNGAVRSMRATGYCGGDTVQLFNCGDIDETTVWWDALRGVDVVVHLAARVHVMSDSSEDPLAEFRRVNVLATERLAKQASEAGVKRFIYLSSIKVNGERTGPNCRNGCFVEEDEVDPQDPYSLSKWEAEQVLWKLSEKTGMEVVVVRPPLVYGPCVRANFLHLLECIGKGVPLPLKLINNYRSMVYIGNLVDLLATCCCHGAAAGKIFFVSDGEDISTPDLVRRIATLMYRPVRLLPCPIVILKLGAGMLGKSAELGRLCGSLQVDINKVKQRLGWVPPFTLDAGLSRTVSWYMSRRLR